MKNKTLINSHLAALLRLTGQDPQSAMEQKELENACKQFTTRLERIIRTTHSPIEVLRTLALAQRLLRNIGACRLQTQHERQTCIEDVRAYLDSEKEIVILQAQYPTLCDAKTDQPRSPLYWSKEFTPTDLVELLAALHLAGAFCKVDGSRAEWALIVEIFAKTLHVRINNPDQCRHAVLNRKLRLTRFLDLLRGKLIEKSEE